MIEASIKSSDLLYLSLSVYDYKFMRTILIVEGINEYKERYQNIIDFFLKANFNVLIYDTRGHGKSINNENGLGVINDANKLIEDLRIVVNYTLNRFPNNEVYILGDSLGATTVINYLQYNERIKKVALVSPLYGSKVVNNLKLAEIMLSVMGKNKESSYFQSLLGFGKGNVIVKDSNELYKLKNNNLTSFNYKNKSIYEIMRLEANISNIKINKTDVLILTGALDKTFSGKENALVLISKITKNIPNINYFDYPNMGHKLLFDYGNTLVLQDILGFFLE